MKEDCNSCISTCLMYLTTHLATQWASIFSVSDRPVRVIDPYNIGLNNKDLRQVAKGSMRIVVYSPTSEFYAVVKDTTTVAELMEAVRNHWGKEYFTLNHSGVMNSHEKLAAYKVTDCSAVQVSYYAEFP